MKLALLVLGIVSFWTAAGMLREHVHSESCRNACRPRESWVRYNGYGEDTCYCRSGEEADWKIEKM